MFIAFLKFTGKVFLAGLVINFVMTLVPANIKGILGNLPGQNSNVS
jgi:hypothetical protein